MTDPTPQLDDSSWRELRLSDYQFACPHLGFDRDPATHARQPTPVHRCYLRPSKPAAPTETHQLRYCLGDRHTACPLLVDPSPHSPRRSVWSLVSLRPAGRTDPGVPSRKLARNSLVLLSIGLAVAAAIVTVFVLAWPDARHASAPSGVDASAIAAPTPTLSRQATSPPVATSTAVATSTPVPSPTRVREYVVEAGDSYSVIAEQFDISVDELLSANSRTLASPLFPGDVLTIP